MTAKNRIEFPFSLRQAQRHRRGAVKMLSNLMSRRRAQSQFLSCVLASESSLEKIVRQLPVGLFAVHVRCDYVRIMCSGNSPA